MANDIIRIRHKVIAKQGLSAPIKFRALPKIDIFINEQGVAEVPPVIANMLLKDPENYELVEEPKEEIKPAEVAEVLPTEELAPAVKAKRERKGLVKTEPDSEAGKAEAEFVKSIVEE